MGLPRLNVDDSNLDLKDLLFGFKDYYRAFGGGGIPKRLGAGCGGNSLSIMGPGLLPIRMFSIC
jgi:hypothetical protein